MPDQVSPAAAGAAAPNHTCFASPLGVDASVLVIGGASLDILHFAGQTAASAGGAGMYTAAAAHRMGTPAAMFAPRPNPMPNALRPAAQRLDWIGREVSPEDLPRFEIAYGPDGAAELRRATWGAETDLSPDDLPGDLSPYSIVHIAAIETAQHQLDFLQACRSRGARRVSAGTYGKVIREETQAVRSLFDQADIFFMNESEALGLFGSVQSAATRPGRLLFVTLGRRGAWVFQGSHATLVAAPAVPMLDPTGAGDTFCGATLALLAQGNHPVMAARRAVALAAQVVCDVGPQALWSEDAPPDERRDPRVRLDEERIAQVAGLAARLPEVQPFAFVGDDYPPAGHPAALDYFFSATLQQFGFWHTREGRYDRPLLAPIGGAVRKGSDYLWRAWRRPLERGETFYDPDSQASLTLPKLLGVFRAADGTDPMPEVDVRLTLARGYGHDMLAMDLSPRAIIEQAQASPRPFHSCLQALDGITGYKEDPLRKKSALLALILQQRPERFLRDDSHEEVPPVIDYHLMRSCLRIGLVTVPDQDLERALAERRVLGAEEEWAIRRAAFDAVKSIVELSGRSMGAVDWFLFNARRRCPEMSAPECHLCPVDPVCAHHRQLFQPVFRTTFY